MHTTINGLMEIESEWQVVYFKDSPIDYPTPESRSRVLSVDYENGRWCVTMEVEMYTGAVISSYDPRHKHVLPDSTFERVPHVVEFQLGAMPTSTVRIDFERMWAAAFIYSGISINLMPPTWNQIFI